MRDKQTIESKDVGSLEDVLGPNDSMFQPETKQEEKKCANCGKLIPKEEWRFGLCKDCHMEYCELSAIVKSNTKLTKEGVFITNEGEDNEVKR